MLEKTRTYIRKYLKEFKFGFEILIIDDFKL